MRIGSPSAVGGAEIRTWLASRIAASMAALSRQSTASIPGAGLRVPAITRQSGDRLAASAAAELGARFDISFAGTGDVFLTRPGPLVSTLKEAVKSVTGRTPALTTGGGTSDARFIKDHCPVVEFGLINATIHQVDEHTSVADLEALTEIYGRFISNYFVNA